MSKIVAMIPARLGSKRIKNKNLRLLGGKPLVCHIIDKAKESEVFDEIYVNSESEIFRDLCREYGIKFYKRSEELAIDDASNDKFVYDFLKNTECDIVIQINPTSPFYTVEDIKNFTRTIVDNNYDTMHGIREEKIEAIFRGKALNFDPFKQMPRSQDLESLLLHAGGLMGWKKTKYCENMEKYNSGTYGCDGKTGYFKLYGFSKIDIDNEEDFQLAEAVLSYLKGPAQEKKEYYQPKLR